MRKLILLMVPLLVWQCKKEPVNTDPFNSFEEVIQSGGEFGPVQKTETILDSSSTTKTEGGQRWRCVTQTVEAKAGAGGSGGFPMFNPNANVIYPGSLLQGASLRKATPDIIAVDRAGGTISYDIIDGNQQSSFTVDRVSKSAITNAMNQIINQSTGIVPANFSFNYRSIQSRQEFALAVEADYENAFLELEGYLELNTSSSYSSYLVRLDQSYYTMSFDIPTNRDQLFAPTVSPQDLALYVKPGNPATYVSDVTYGRIYYMLIESTSSSFDLEAGISGSFSGIASSGGGSVDASYLSTLDNLKIQVFAYGGEASATLRTVVDASSLDSLVNKLAAAGDIGSAKPISYVVRSVYNNQIVSVQLANTYDVTNCEPIGSGNTPPAATSHWVDVVRDFGAIGSAINMGSQRIALFNKAGNRFMLSENGQLTGPYNLSDLADGNMQLTSVGAGGLYTNGSWTGNIYFFDLNGNSYQQLNGGVTFNTNTFSIGSFLGGNCPFNAQGITALSYLQLTDNGNTTNNMIAINKAGDEYALYNTSTGDWSLPQTLPNLEINGNELPFNSLGAACYLYIGQQDYTVFFNQQGTQYCLWDHVNGFSPAYDL
jgi:thiol-activated cytolysin